MPRQLRIEYEGAIYHVMNRGDRREPIFNDDRDRSFFLEALGEACAKTGWQIHAYCLMENHFHLVLETPQANLVSGMKWFLGTYTNRFNRRHKLCGHLFSGRYKSLIVDGGRTGYLRTVCGYVHLNPARAKLVTPERPLRTYLWSSFGEYLRPPNQRVPWLRVDRLLGEMGIPADTSAGRREFERLAEARRFEDSETEWSVVRRGWCLGDESFRRELLNQVRTQSRESHYALPRQESAEEKAEQLVAEELRRRGLPEATLEQLRKGHSAKVEIARKLRQETTVTLKWIAQRLKMGQWTHAANCISRENRRLLGKENHVERRRAVLPCAAAEKKQPSEMRQARQFGTDRAKPIQEPAFSHERNTLEKPLESEVRTDPFDLPTHCL